MNIRFNRVKLFSISTVRNILFVLYAIYFLQGSLYEQGSIISQSCLFVIIALSFYFFIRSLLLKNKQSLFFVAWTTLFSLNIIGFIFTADYGNKLHFDLFKEILVCLLTFYPFYYFSQKGILGPQHLIFFLIIMLPITILNFFSNQENILGDRSSRQIVNNVSYSFVRLLPFVFLIEKRKFVGAIIILICMVFIINGAKRGAIISGSVFFVLYIFYQFKNVNKKYRVLYYFIILATAAFMSYYIYTTLMENEFLIARLNLMTEGGSSGRDTIFTSIWNKWYNSDSILNILFGYGFAASLKMTGGSYAHNDWLELLSNFGLTGVVIYLLLVISAFKYIRNKFFPFQKRYLMFSIVIAWLFISMFSMWYNSMLSYTQAMLLAYLISNQTNNYYLNN